MAVAQLVFRPPQPDDPHWVRCILLRRGTTDEWVTVNPVLVDKEAGLDTTRDTIRIGPGHWNDLADATPDQALRLLTGARP